MIGKIGPKISYCINSDDLFGFSMIVGLINLFSFLIDFPPKIIVP
jgi:hypothetical protein